MISGAPNLWIASFNASASQLSNSATNSSSYGLGAAYTTGGLTVALGYGSNQFGFATTITQTEHDEIDSNEVEEVVHFIGTVSNGTVTDTSLSATYVMGDTTVKAIYQDKQVDGTYSSKSYLPGYSIGEDMQAATDVSAQATSMGLSVSHVMGALTLTGFGVSTDLSSDLTSDAKENITFTRSGISASYDLGGGASLKAGAVRVEAPNLTLDPVEESASLSTVSYSAYDVGVSFKF